MVLLKIVTILPVNLSGIIQLPAFGRNFISLLIERIKISKKSA